MAFYASATNTAGSKKVLAIGPFRRHGDALRAVELFRRWASDNTHEGRNMNAAYGTARDRLHHAPGRFNVSTGVAVDNDGWAVLPEGN